MVFTDHESRGSAVDLPQNLGVGCRLSQLRNADARRQHSRVDKSLGSIDEVESQSVKKLTGLYDYRVTKGRAPSVLIARLGFDKSLDSCSVLSR